MGIPIAVMGQEGGDSFPGLHLVDDALFLDPDEIVVANGVSQSLVVFDAAGRYRRQIGRPGDGPGEFARVRSVHWLSTDTIGVWDSAARRFTTFTGDGEVSTTERVEGTARGFRPLDVVGSGTTLLISQTRSGNDRRSVGTYRDERLLARADTRGMVPQELGLFQGSEHFWSGRIGFQVPLSYRFYTAAAARNPALRLGRCAYSSVDPSPGPECAHGQ
jgi:hypothetical protein